MIGDKLRKVLALWRGAATDGERQAARARGEVLAKQEGMSFEQAVSADAAERASASGAGFNPFDGFDDFCEAREPGYKAERAREKAEKVAARERRKAGLIERFGSLQAALAPCEREKLIIAAVARWRVPQNPPHERWTSNVDGWRSSWEEPPPHVEAAIRGAYRLPETFAAARAELDYWRERNDDMGALLDDDYGDYALDLLAMRRMRIVDKLLEEELTARTAADVLERFRLYRDRAFHDYDSETRIFEDLERVVAAESAPRLSTMDTCAYVQSVHSAAPVQSGQIEAALAENPARSDRSLAREFGVSPTTVGKIRARLGLAGAARSVRRRGQMFEAQYGGAGVRLKKRKA
jgi:hypothetical protein